MTCHVGWQQDMHESVSGRVHEHEVIQIVGLQVSERTPDRLIAVAHRRREGANLAETLNGLLRTGLSNGYSSVIRVRFPTGAPGLADRHDSVGCSARQLVCRQSLVGRVIVEPDCGESDERQLEHSRDWKSFGVQLGRQICRTVSRSQRRRSQAANSSQAVLTRSPCPCSKPWCRSFSSLAVAEGHRATYVHPRCSAPSQREQDCSGGGAG
jgi:hypothetical protein